MDVGFEAKDSIPKEAENPKCGKPHSTFLEWRAFLANRNRDHWIILVILTTKLMHHRSSGWGMLWYFAKAMGSADLLIPQLAQLYCLDTASLGFSPPSITRATGTSDRGRTACPSQRSEQADPAGMSPIGLVEGKKKRYRFGFLHGQDGSNCGQKRSGFFWKRVLTCYRLLARLELFPQIEESSLESLLFF